MINPKDYIAPCVFGILCVSALFAQSRSFTDSYIVPKWLIVLLIALVIGFYWSVRRLFAKPLKVNMCWMGIGVVAVCLSQALYGLLQYFRLLPSHSLYQITGSFDNPAGFAAALCCGLPFIGFLLSNKNNYIRYTGWITGGVITAAVILSHSRAGIISIAIIGAILLYRRLSCHGVWKYVIVTGFALLFIGSYWLKKDSADGRLLIWQCSIDMAKDAPWLGHGVGSFEAHYMDYQAEYFRTHEQNRYAMLADNVKQPFNEYLGVLLNFGILGLFLLVAIIVLLIYCYTKHPNLEKRIAAYALISIATFSLFSYPFTYPFTWIIAFLCIVMLARESVVHLFATFRIKNTVCVLVLVCSLVGIYKLTERIRTELEWNKASVQALCGAYDKALPFYKKLEKAFDDNPYFLYNYAAILKEKKHYAESLGVALQCRKYWADYDLELIIGENYQQLKKFEEAEAYYRNASQMCHSRFYPLNYLYDLYKEMGEEHKALEIAREIINKPVKVESLAIKQMKYRMKQAILKSQTLKQAAQ